MVEAGKDLIMEEDERKNREGMVGEIEGGRGERERETKEGW